MMNWKQIYYTQDILLQLKITLPKNKRRKKRERPIGIDSVLGQDVKSNPSFKIFFFLFIKLKNWEGIKAKTWSPLL